MEVPVELQQVVGRRQDFLGEFMKVIDYPVVVIVFFVNDMLDF